MNKGRPPNYARTVRLRKRRIERGLKKKWTEQGKSTLKAKNIRYEMNERNIVYK